MPRTYEQPECETPKINTIEEGFDESKVNSIYIVKLKLYLRDE